MKKFILSVLVSFSLFSSYEEKVKTEYVKNLNFPNSIFSPEDIPSELKKHFNLLKEGESVSLFFYPKGCGFDQMVGDTSIFLDIRLLKSMARNLGYKILYSDEQGHMAFFEDKQGLSKFMKKHLKCDLDDKKLSHLSFFKDEAGNLLFPTKICILQLEKRSL